MEKLITRFLYSNGYSNEVEKIIPHLYSHPDFPSLKCITDSLDYFGIENIVISVPGEGLEKLPQWFLAMFDNGGEGEMMVFIQKKRHKVVLYFEDGRKRILSLEGFKKKWTGTIIVIERLRTLPIKPSKLFKTTLVSAFLLLALIHIYSFEGLVFSLSLVACAGCFLSYFIVQEQLGIYNKTVFNVCYTFVKDTRCADIINSRYGKVSKNFSLSDACVVFFTASLLIHSLMGFNYVFSFIVAAGSIIMVLSSFYNQAFLLKQWCALCLGVMVLLAVQAILIVASKPAFDFSLAYNLKALFLFVFIYAIWKRVRDGWEEKNNLKKTEKEFLKFRRNPRLFFTNLHSQPNPENYLIPSENEISFGQRRPVVTIEVVTNPLCGFCEEAFATYDKLMRLYGDKIKINIIFNVPFKDPENIACRIALRILEIYYTGGADIAFEAYINWFKYKHIQLWELQFGELESVDEDMMDTLQYHRDWCVENNILHTPATLIDGYIYPKEYPTSDILFFMETIVSEKIAQNRL
jgi:hypothetical protein